MTASGVIAAARDVLRVQRRQHAITMAGRPRGERNALVQALGFAMVLVMRAWGPLWVVYFTWRKADVTIERKSVLFGALAAAGVVFASGHLFQSSALSFSAREVLFLPDKASVLLARLVRALPALLWIGGGWAAAVWLCLRDEWPHQPVLVVIACMTALLAPLSRNVGVLLQRLVAPDAGSILTPALLVALCAGYLVGPAQWTGDIERVSLSWTVLLFALLPFAGLVHGCWKATRASVRELWLDIVRLPRAIVLVVLVVPPVVWRDSVWLPVAACAGVAAVVVLMPLALCRVLRMVNGAEAETRGAAIERMSEHGRATDERTRRVAPPPVHRGRSLSRATWRFHWLQHGITRHDLLRPAALVGFLMRHGTGIAIAGVLAWVGRDSPTILLVFGAIGGPVWSSNLSRERLLLLGVDLRAQVRQQVVTVLWSAALPALFAAALVAAMTRRRPEVSVLVIAALAAGFLLRIGWRGLMPRPESARLRAAFGLFVLLGVAAEVAARLLPVPRPGVTAEMIERGLASGETAHLLQTSILQWPIVGAVAVLGVVGLVRRVALWREPELLADLIAARERESRPEV